MNVRRPAAARACIAGLAALGVVVAHKAAYSLGTVNVHDRANLAETAGHAYMPYLTAVALGLLVAALARFACIHIGNPKSVGAASSYWQTASRLVMLQTTGFVALELSERILLGIDPTHLFSESVLAVGIVAQLVLSLLGALLLILFGKGVVALAKLVRRFSPALAETRQTFWKPNGVRIHSRVSLASISLRGPPLLA